jgi:3-hydroxyanthranilate 3,4-dioxygenase
MLPPLTNFHLRNWVDANREQWGPPAKLMLRGSDYITFVIRGPTSPADFHINPGEEIFYMIEGQVNFHFINADGNRDILAVRSGEMFLLPAGVPHSPHRLDGSVGLVIERKRRSGELDRQIWLCNRCNSILYEITYRFEGPDDAMRAVQEGTRILADESRRACAKCGSVDRINSF